MAILKIASFLTIATACYSPDVRDCTVVCSSAADCAPSQLCGNDGFCASPEMAGTCARIASVDATPVDAAPMPDGAMPDAPPLPTVRLRVRIEGRGDVAVDTIGSCDGGNGAAECWFDVPKNLPVTLIATAKNNWGFEKWEEACKEQPTTECVVTPNTEIHAKARFVLGD